MRPEWARRLDDAVLTKYPDINTAARVHGFDGKTFWNWCHGRRVPNKANRARLHRLFGNVGIPLARRYSRFPWCLRLRRAVYRHFTKQSAAAAAMGVSERSLRSWLRGDSVPPATFQVKITAVLGDVGLPPPTRRRATAEFDKHLKRLRWEQQLFAACGYEPRTYTLEEIGGGYLSRQRVAQIEQGAIAKIRLALAGHGRIT
jgi:DNA-binding transcriptional regulator YiaG